MKKIKPISLKDSKILSVEELKHLFGGSAGNCNCNCNCNSNSGSAAACRVDAACIVSRDNIAYSGTCTVSITQGTLSCDCEVIIDGFPYTVSGHSDCYRF